MFYWMKSSGGSSDAVDGLGDISKAEILRGIVTEKLSTAAREILAVVERTVAGYEEEASGFRKEIDRQRRQLEVLLQPRVKLERRGFTLDGDPDPEVLDVSEEQQETDAVTLGLLCYDEDEDEDEEAEGEEYEQPMEEASAPSAKQQREVLKDPDYQTPSNRPLSSHGSERRKPGRPRLSEKRNDLHLRIRILEDSQIDFLSKAVFQKCPVQELQCPLSLQEADFLSLLGSTFPQLANQKPFDVFTTDRSRRLRPLGVQTLTPMEIRRSMSSAGAGNSALYIRLRTAGDQQSGSTELQPQKNDRESPSSSSTLAVDQSQTCSRFLSPEQKRRGRPPLRKNADQYTLRLCFLEEVQSDPPSKRVLVKSAVQQLRCPQGLQESDFLLTLRSRFPQLDGDDRAFDLFTLDRSRKLTRLRVDAVTPDEICRSLKPCRVEMTTLYIRLKTGEDDEEEGRFPQIKNHTSSESPPAAAVRTISDEAELHSSSSTLKQQADMHADGAERDYGLLNQTDEVVSDSDVDDDGGDDDEKNKDDDDWRPSAELQTARRRRQPKTSGVHALWLENRKIPCKVCGVWYRQHGSLIKHAWTHVDEAPSVCAVCNEHFGSAEDLKTHLKSHQETHECSFCGKSFLTVSSLNSHITRHTGERPYKCDVCSKSFASVHRLTVHHWVHVADKPHKCDVCHREFGLKAQLRAHSRVHTGKDRYRCNMCGKTLCDLRSLARHKATHSEERAHGCQICGKCFKTANTLKSHEKIHTVRDKTYLCDICCKTFTSNSELKAHLKTHSNERPFSCLVCSKRFISNGELKIHLRVHTGEAPYSCSQCGRHFKYKNNLNEHMRTHLGIRPYTCGVCGKTCSRQDHLKVHMRTHNGDRPYKCSLCDKAFTQSHCLKTHMKSHQENEMLLNSPSD